MNQAKSSKSEPLDRIKRLAIIALFSDDELAERFVLKGGNALAIAYGLDMRVSSDLDLSMPNSFDDTALEDVRMRIAYQLEQTFKPEGLMPFDVYLKEKPKVITQDMASFWGGYCLEFKLIDLNEYDRLGGNSELMRKQARITNPNERRRFEVDISRFEICDPFKVIEIDGYLIRAYEPILIVFEKLRAICQQMPEYDSIVKRNRDQHPSRSRDFLDIHTVMTELKPDLASEEARELLLKVFEAKRVPIDFLKQIPSSYDQHFSGWQGVVDTVRSGFALEDFQFYFNYTVDLVDRLHPLGNV